MRKISRIINVACAVLVAVLMNGTLNAAMASAYTPPVGQVSEVTICHASNSDGDPYITNTPSAVGVGTNTGNGDHGTHIGPIWNSTLKNNHQQWGDIIPPFTDTSGRSFPGLNWTTAGQLIYANDCNVPTTAVTASADACAPISGVTSATVTVTNNVENSVVTVYNSSNVSVYTSGTISPAVSSTIAVPGLAAGNYTVKVTNMNQEVTASTAFTVAQCAPAVPAQPSVTAHIPKCSLANSATGAVSATVTNTDDDTNAAATYTWQIKQGDTVVQSGTTNPIADGATDTFSATGLAAGNYTVVITGSDQTTDSATFTVPVCQLAVEPCEAIIDEPLVSTRSEFADRTDGAQSGNYEFTPNGVRIWIENGKNAWYHAVNFPLSDAGVPAMDYTQLSGDFVPGMQMVIDFDGNGTVDGTLVGESAYGDNWWLTNGSAQSVKDNAPHNGGGYGSPWYGTLDEWLTNFPSAQVKYVGYSLGTAANGEGVLHSLTFGCHKWTFGLEEVSEVPAPVKDDTCYNDNDWYYVPEESENIEYRVNGEVVTGWEKVEGTSVTITAHAKEGYYIPESMTTEWTFTYTNEQCITITKTADMYVDANNNGRVDAGDYVKWNIVLTNNSNESLDDEYLDDHFFVGLVDEGATFEMDKDYVDNLAPHASVTLHVTKPLTASEITACKANNTAVFYAWRNGEESDTVSDSAQALAVEDELLSSAVATGSASASLSMVCGNVLGDSTVKPAKAVAQQLPAELPATGGENNYLLLGIVLSTLTYFVVLRRQDA